MRAAATRQAQDGIREDIGIFVRSSWEANYARYLTHRVAAGEIEAWEYEPKVFHFPDINRGPRLYTPDFRVRELGGAEHYVELKGWMDERSKAKLSRMRRYHPGVEVRVIDAEAYRAIETEFSTLIEGWE